VTLTEERSGPTTPSGHARGHAATTRCRRFRAPDTGRVPGRYRRPTAAL